MKWLNFSLLLIILKLTFIYGIEADQCLKYKSLWFSLKYPYTSELLKFSGKKLKSDSCQNSVCCDGTMQKEIFTVSQLKMKSISESYILELVTFYSNNSNSLRNFIRSNIDDSKNILHKMFMNTYNKNYLAHKQFFMEFFEKLKLYMESGTPYRSLSSIINDFFNEMASRILQMMEVSVAKNPNKIRCLTQFLLQKEPYQGAEKSIEKTLLESYPFTRIFLNSLEATNDIFLDFIKDMTTPSDECTRNYAKLFQCSLCSMSDSMACPATCIKVFAKCLGSLNNKEVKKVHKSWLKMINAQIKLAKHLDNRFNFPRVNENLHLRISSAIMNIHNYFPRIRSELLRKCSKMSRQKRSFKAQNWNNYLKPSTSRPVSRLSDSKVQLTHITNQYLQQVVKFKDYFKQFKHTVCMDKKMNLAKAEQKCWNGTGEINNFNTAKDRSGSKKKSKPPHPNVIKLIKKINKITNLINSILFNGNNDPTPIEIKYKNYYKSSINSPAFPKKVFKSLVSSGDSDSLRNPPQPPVFNLPTRPPQKPKPSNSNYNNNNFNPNGNKLPLPNLSSDIDGSGQSQSTNNNKNNNIIPETPPKPYDRNKKPELKFPNIPNNNNNNMNINKKPNKVPIKTPNMLPDDEDLVPSPNSTPKPSFLNNIGGSGSEPNIVSKDNKTINSFINPNGNMKMELFKKSTPPNRINSLPNMIEGSGDSKSTYPPIYPINKNNKFGMVTSKPLNGLSTKLPIVATKKPNIFEFPGDIPQEIWIPQVLDDQNYGRIHVTDAGNSANYLLLTGESILFLLCSLIMAFTIL